MKEQVPHGRHATPRRICLTAGAWWYALQKKERGAAAPRTRNGSTQTKDCWRATVQTSDRDSGGGSGSGSGEGVIISGFWVN